MNIVILSGHLTRDPEVRFAQSGVAIVSGGAATNRRVKRGEEWKDEPVFIDYVMFGKRGEAFAKHHKKGDPFIFEKAELVFDQWEDKQTGQKRSKLKLQVESWEFAGRRDVGSEASTTSAQDAAQSTTDSETPF